MSVRHSRWRSWAPFGFWLHVWTEPGWDGDLVVGIESDRTGRTFELVRWRRPWRPL